MASNSPPTVIYKPAWVANTFLVRSREDGVADMTQLKVQKLVYCMHGWTLAVTGHPVVGERFEAWPHGPVLASLYSHFKEYRWHRITSLAEEIDPRTGEEAALVISEDDQRFFDIFNRVWSRYRHYDGKQLSDMTHQPNTPWSYARQNGLQYLSDAMIREHFVALGAAH